MPERGQLKDWISTTIDSNKFRNVTKVPVKKF
jgi:hypothetical protein